MVYTERQMDARREILGKIDAATDAKAAALKPAWERHHAELDRMNAEYNAATAALWNRYRADSDPIIAPYDERIRALRSELDAVSQPRR